ncbi:MAG: pyridoxamine 5'-phosphate oxidase [Gammaproteobacteria bacterium]|nr:pyridoxamine 5'-phosphate oxidase [Gammaproteobacteria bacterium]
MLKCLQGSKDIQMNCASWGEFEQAMPELAAFGRDRLDGKVSYLATVRKNGQPRAHPVTPIVGGGYCFIFVEPSSPKVHDLMENGHFCLHCAMNDSSGSSGEFQVTGVVRQIEESELRSEAESISSFRPSARYLLFELRLAEVISTSYLGGRPSRHKWVQTADAG